AGAQDCFRRILRRAANAPGQSEPGRKVSMIRYVVLRFETEPIPHGEIGAEAPIILGVQAGVKPTHANSRIPHRAGAHRIIGRAETAGDQSLYALPICQTPRQLLVCLDSRELHARAGTRGARSRSLPGSKGKCAVEIGSFKVFVAVFAQPGSKLHEVFA